MSEPAPSQWQVDQRLTADPRREVDGQEQGGCRRSHSSVRVLPFNFLRDAAPVARLVRMVNPVVVHPSVSANTLGEFIALVIEKSGIKGPLRGPKQLLRPLAKYEFLATDRWQIKGN
jgi:hypothetical protein